MGGGRAGGMLHQGPRPTFQDAERSIEVHVFARDLSLYGASVKVSWVERIRDVRSFTSAKALKDQLDKDFAKVEDALTGWAPPASH
jgi:riboflavin kinase/FMN adenylyltransferase